ncbi:MAG: S24/S26 family peptidase [Deltaproteobacteria bacterium]|nr:S24/S26 family peptidase [Deltaproteobacteria bacterium]
MTDTDLSTARRRRALELQDRHVATHGETVISFRGHSMAPTLRNDDQLRVRHVSVGDLVPGDVVVFTADAHTVVHRLLYVSRAGSTAPYLRTKGDNATACDPPVEPAALFGRVSCVVRGSKEITLSGRRWRAGALAIVALSLTEHTATAILRTVQKRRSGKEHAETRARHRVRTWRSRLRGMLLHLFLGLAGR